MLSKSALDLKDRRDTASGWGAAVLDGEGKKRMRRMNWKMEEEEPVKSMMEES